MKENLRKCPACRGKGIDSASISQCSACRGHGEVVPLTLKQGKQMMPKSSFAGLKREGYEATPFLEVGPQRMAMVFKDEDV